MKAIYEEVFDIKNRSIMADLYSVLKFDAGYHYHPEYEITYILESDGKRVVGNHVAPFKKGDFVFIGPSVPHSWINTEEYYLQSKRASAIVVQFKSELFPVGLKKTLELSHIYQLLSASKKGIHFQNPSANIIGKLHEICKTDVTNKYNILLQLLTEMSYSKNYKYLNYQSDIASGTNIDKRYEKILSYIFNNYNQHIVLQTVADFVGMNKSSLCRYLKKQYNTGFTDLLNKVRIENASLLLRETNLEISAVAYDCGFSSLTYFCTVFKSFKNCSPGEYRRSIAGYTETTNL